MARWRRVLLIGPHPVRVARTIGFLARRRAQRKWLRHRYDALVAGDRCEGPLRAPPVALGRLTELPPRLRAPAAALVEEADDVLRHRVDFLGSGMVDLGERIDWHTDFKSGYRWAPRFYQEIEITRLDDDSDAKVPWELSRGHHLLTLARAARLTGDPVYRAALISQLEDWLDANPPGRGINWVTPMELGIRAVNWLWILGTLAGDAPLPRELERRMAGTLHWHGRHIRANLEGTPYLRSNHYLGDILGLLAVGLACPEDPHGRRWSDQAVRAFEREIRRQVHSDGVGFEGSLSYHGLCMEMFVIARRLTDLAGRRMSSGYDARLGRMLQVSRAVRHPDGRIPQFGDQDSGRVLPAGFGRPPSHDPLLWLASAVLGLDAPLPGPPDPEVAWTLGLDAEERMAKAPLRAPDAASRFPVGGLYVLRGGQTHAVVRCGDVGQGGAGGHAHNDLLSFEATFGVPIVVDSGTYAYTFDIAARHAMRGSGAHNVVVVDREEINPLDEREVFRLAQVAHPTIHEWSETGEAVRLVVSHSGYERLASPVVVRRTFVLQRASGTLVVNDELLGTGRHVVESYLHLAPGSAATTTQSGVHVQREGWAVHVETVGERAPIDIGSGWVSDRYGAREQAPLLTQQRSGELPMVLNWTFEPVRVSGPSTAAQASSPAPSSVMSP